MAEIHQLHTKSDFDRAWDIWPNKIAKKIARQAFERAKSDPDWPGIEGLIAGIENYKRNKPEWKAWMHFATYLNQARWEDEYERKSDPWDKL